MKLYKHYLTYLTLSLTILFSCSPQKEEGYKTPKDDGSNWERYGRTYKEDHFSPLNLINDENIERLGLSWFYDLPTSTSSGVAAPLAVDGVLFFATGHSLIHAMNAVTGELLWRYDPEVYEVVGEELRGSWGVRGIAYSNNKVFTGTVDGRLIAIDAKKGTLLWSANTTEKNDGRYITGPPYVIGDKVIIGHGGADFRPVRGYVTAYNIETGEKAWRFFTVPGNPKNGFENEAMRLAAKTWTGEWWKYGGGGTVWHAMAYDPEFNHVYIGTGNGAPWNQKIRSPGGGDNLFLSSIVALDADTGDYIWHYQSNPGDTWDYNAAMDIELAEIPIDGISRKVILHAPKNGFFYVIDRKNGELISAEPFANVNWAEKIDIDSGRPIENPMARYPDNTPFMMSPDASGAHGVAAMSFNPNTKLVYLPVRNRGGAVVGPSKIEDWKYSDHFYLETGMGMSPADLIPPKSNGWLSAWDPIDQKEVWRVDMVGTKNGGTMTTAGNLVVQGQATGELSVYTADSGNKIWSFDTQNGINAQPITYKVNGKQYITQLVGWQDFIYSGQGPRWDYRSQKRRVLTFALDADKSLPPLEKFRLPITDIPDFIIDENLVTLGEELYNRSCLACHGPALLADGAAPNLLRSQISESLEAMIEILHKGTLLNRGMPPYPELSVKEIEGLQHYIRKSIREEISK
ncbi:MAG: PQQ-dependent dehydrogenase, methanol/ethanol family [SAR86 cluster bacterium]|jgi:quinohemoprotein ethanol dehydrogenase|nr:PQQ-dependent dehydrogenase, methanol/ethanol family [SAR86 cluster bacterium]